MAMTLPGKVGGNSATISPTARPHGEDRQSTHLSQSARAPGSLARPVALDGAATLYPEYYNPASEPELPRLDP